MLVTISLVQLYSLGANQEEANLTIFYRQLIFLFVGLSIVFFLGRIEYRSYQHYARVFYWVGIVLLVAVLVAGETIRGTKGWLSFFGQTFQPVEVVKIFTALYLADYFAARRGPILSLAQLIPGAAIVLLPFALVLLGGEMGSALLLLVLWLGALFFFNLRVRYFTFVLIILGLLSVFSWFAVLNDVQRGRIESFVQPSRDAFGAGYQVRQSVIAIGSGGFFGRGFGLGSQSQLNFLPVQETDFIFAVVAEEFGLMGVLLVLLLFAIFLLQILRLAQKSENVFAMVFLGCMFVLFVTQIFFNIGMNLRLAPVAGVPLPFLSYGGSAMLANFFALSVIVSIAAFRKN